MEETCGEKVTQRFLAEAELLFLVLIAAHPEETENMEEPKSVEKVSFPPKRRNMSIEKKIALNM